MANPNLFLCNLRKSLITFIMVTGILIIVTLPSPGAEPMPTAYSDWMADYGIVEDQSDEDGDGIPALVEYNLGLSPQIHDVFNYQRIRLVGNNSLNLDIIHNPLVTDTSISLHQWDEQTKKFVSAATSPVIEGNRIHYAIALTGSEDQAIYRLHWEHLANGYFMGGADISTLARIEEAGGRFYENGEEYDLIELLRAHGFNWFRLRLFVDPNFQNQVVNDLNYTLSLAQRIKSAGGGFLLDLHYSDTWADPAKQYTPAAWQSLSLSQLEMQVEVYTGLVLESSAGVGALPDMVQIGNEIRNGFLWPTGELYAEGSDPATQWQQFTDLLKAGVRAVKSVEKNHAAKINIMMHVHGGGDLNETEYFFSQLQGYGVAYDVIGLSYYPWWHGTLVDLSTNMIHTSATFHKPVIVVETAYPHMYPNYWEAQPNMAWAVSGTGQEAFLNDLANTIKAIPGGYGAGLFYWYPEAINVNGINVWNGGATALFDTQGEALPSITVFE